VTVLQSGAIGAIGNVLSSLTKTVVSFAHHDFTMGSMCYTERITTTTHPFKGLGNGLAALGATANIAGMIKDGQAVEKAAEEIGEQTSTQIWIGGSKSKAGSQEDFTTGYSGDPQGLQLGKIENWENKKLLTELKDALTDGTFGTFDNDAELIAEHFASNTGADFFWGAEVTNEIESNSSTVDLQKEIAKQFRNQIQEKNGKIDLINILVTPPNLGIESISLKTLIGGTQQVDIWISEFQMDSNNNYSAKITYRIMDDFGVGASDISNASIVAQFGIEGLKSLWVLQHQRGFKPFRTSAKFEFHVKGGY
jgi:hypothetical protein